MSIALSDFWLRIVEAGVTDSDGCREIARRYADENDGVPPADARKLGEFMARSGLLTGFQASALASSAPVAIRLGDFLQYDPAASPPPVVRWSRVNRVIPQSTAPVREAGLLFRITPENFPAGAVADPNLCLQWLAAHAALQADSLQPIELAATTPNADRDLVFTRLDIDGRTLYDPATGQIAPMPADQVAGLGIQVCSALDALHRAGVCHGGVRGDRVWINRGGDAVLLREPIAAPESPLALTERPQNNGVCLLDTVDPPVNYAAPEFANSATCTPQTDIYSLGCLLFHLVTGRAAFAHRSPSETFSAHCAAGLPAELTAAVENAQAGDPLLRVLAYAMAKLPQSRFTTAAQFADALTAVMETYAPAIPPQGIPPQGIPPQENQPQKQSPATGDAESSTPAQSPRKEPTEAKLTPAKAKLTPARASAPSTPAPGPERSTQTPRPEATKSKPSLDDASRHPRTPVPTETRAFAPKTETQTNTAPVSDASGRPPVTPPVAPAPVAPPPVAPPSASSITPSSQSPSPKRPGTATTDRSADAATPAGRASHPDDRAARRGRRRKKKTLAPLVLGGMGVVVLLLLLIGLVFDPGASSPTSKPRFRPPPPAQTPPVIASRAAPARTNPTRDADQARRNVAGYEVVRDDQLPWAPPYAVGAPASLQLLPPGPPMILWVNLRELSRSELYQSLEPELASFVGSVTARSKVAVDAMDSCGIAIHATASGPPDVSLAVRLREPIPLADLLERWDAAESRTATGERLYAGDQVGGDAYFVDSDASGVTGFAVGSIPRITEVAEFGGGSIPLPRSLESLWRNANRDAGFHLLSQPNFLFADGRELLQSSAPEIVGPLKSFLVPEVGGFLVSLAESDGRVYVETRFEPTGTSDTATVVEKIRRRVDSWPEWANNFLVDSTQEATWKLLAVRLPMMVRFVQRQVRVGASENAALANFYLPTRAATQTGLATLLAMNTPTVAGSKTAPAMEVVKLSIDQMLARTMSINFEQEPLEFAINAIVDEFESTLPPGNRLPPVRIIGADLEAMGITQNQQIRNFVKADRPLRSVLTDLVMGANPDKTATGPSDPKQALVWVIAKDPESPDQPAILVTTRAAAKSRYQLPDEFTGDGGSEQ